MSTAAALPAATDETDGLDGWERALLDRQLEALNRLADMGMAIADAITQRATAPASEPVQDLDRAALDFARVSRAVRMTFALQSRLIADFKGAPETRSAGSGGPGDWGADFVGRPDIVDHDVVRKRQVRGIVEQLAEGASLDGAAAERLAREAAERLEDERFYRDLTERPMGEIVALICKDLGLEPDWELLSDIYWAKAEIETPPARLALRRLEGQAGQGAAAGSERVTVPSAPPRR